MRERGHREVFDTAWLGVPRLAVSKTSAKRQFSGERRSRVSRTITQMDCNQQSIVPLPRFTALQVSSQPASESVQPSSQLVPQTGTKSIGGQ